jgi:hypothetical protein
MMSRQEGTVMTRALAADPGGYWSKSLPIEWAPFQIRRSISTGLTKLFNLLRRHVAAAHHRDRFSFLGLVRRDQRCPDDAWPNPTHGTTDIGKGNGRRSRGLLTHDGDKP